MKRVAFGEVWGSEEASHIHVDNFRYRYDRNSNRLPRKNEMTASMSELHHPPMRRRARSTTVWTA